MTVGRLESHVLGSLATACIGDALGAPTEQRSIAEIHSLWGGRVERFEEPPEDAPFAKGRRSAQITDDASQMLALVDAYIHGGGSISVEGVAAALLEWADNQEYFPRFAGPTTKAAIERLRAGDDPRQTGRVGRLTSEGTSNGAAMRVAPAGLAHPGDIEAAIADALITCLPTHATNLAMSGAAAVAGAVAIACAPGAGVVDVVRAARYAAARGAQLGAEHGRDVAGPSVVVRLDHALELAASASDFDDAVQRIANGIGTGLHIAEAVPAAIAIFMAAEGDPLLSVIGGANGGDDTDTVACIAGSIAGALRGLDAVPAHLLDEVIAANHLRLHERASAFCGVTSPEEASTA